MADTTRQKLQEVLLIRPILIVLLVVYHAFIIYAGGWSQPDGFVPHEGYAWIARFSYSFMLEMFVFISGYVWAYQRLELNRQISFGKLVQQKSKRLLLPSVVFSIVYLLCFEIEGLTTPPEFYMMCCREWDICGFSRCCFGAFVGLM